MTRTVGALYHFMRADFLERIRRNSFLITLALTVYAGYLFVPPLDAPYVTFIIGNHSGVYNSAWVGMIFGAVSVLLLPLIGFYLIKNAIDRDYQTGVRQIIATTPTGKPLYILGKWLSNLAVLTVILCVLTVMAPVMQLVRAEDLTVNLWALVVPIWAMGLPMVAICAAVAVLFESIPFLRGGFGNVVAFFLWGATLSGGWMPVFLNPVNPHNDLLGISKPAADIQLEILAIDPEADMGTGGLFGPKVIMEEEVGRFIWEGTDWTTGMILERLVWVGVAIAVALAASIPFDRFDSTAAQHERKSRRRRRRRDLRVESADTPSTATTRLTPLSATAKGGRFFGTLASELKLLLKGRRWLWYVVAAGLVIACLPTPLDIVRRYLLPAAWVWPVMIWSQMGTREARHNTGQIVFSAPHPVMRQLPAAWLAGVVIAAITGSGAAVRFALAGESASLLAWAVGVLFIPALAVALGVWSGNSRAFEVVYLLLWYVGPMNQFAALDYAGVTAEGLAMGMPVVYAGITVVLLVAACMVRETYPRNIQ